jgi:hypothetical protein
MPSRADIGMEFYHFRGSALRFSPESVTAEILPRHDIFKPALNALAVTPVT